MESDGFLEIGGDIGQGGDTAFDRLSGEPSLVRVTLSIRHPRPTGPIEDLGEGATFRRPPFRFALAYFRAGP